MKMYKEGDVIVMEIKKLDIKIIGKIAEVFKESDKFRLANAIIVSGDNISTIYDYTKQINKKPDLVDDISSITRNVEPYEFDLYMDHIKDFYSDIFEHSIQNDFKKRGQYGYK